jgi:cbb3-type cytochrome oxidase subunit 3
LADEKAAIDNAVNKINTGFAGEIITSTAADPAQKTHEIVGKIISGLLGIVGTITLCIFIYGGIMWMFSGGKDQDVTKAQNTMIWAALGLFAILSSYMIINYVIDKLTF